MIRALYGFCLFLAGVALVWRGDKIHDPAVALGGIAAALMGILIMVG